MYRIYLEHGEAYGNLGDEAMLINAARRLREKLGQVEFIVPRKEGAPLPEIGTCTYISPPHKAVFELMRRLVPSGRLRSWLHRRSYDPLALITPKIMELLGGIGNWRVLLKHLEQCDIVYCVGAANLNDYARLGCVLPKSMLVQQAYKMSKPVIVSSQTVGPLNINWTRKAVRSMVTQSRFFSLRDGGISREVLTASGVDPAQLHFVGDEAFSLPPATVSNARDYLENQGVSPEEPFGLLHFRATDYTQSTQKYFGKIAEALDEADLESRVCFLPMSYWKHSGMDEECGLAIQQRMRSPGKLKVLKTPRDVQVVRRLFDMAQWAMGLSYHVQVFALAAACPMAILTSGEYYEIKATGMRQLVGDAIPLLRLSEVSPDTIARTGRRLERERAQFTARLKEVRAEVSKKNQTPVDVAGAVLRGKVAS